MTNSPIPQMPAPTSIPDTTSETTTIQTGPSLMNDPPAIHNEDASPTFALESKAKRSRNVTTPYQLQVLNRVWIQTAFPDAKLRETLAKSLGMTPRAVQIWFQNQRQKARSRNSFLSKHPTNDLYRPIPTPVTGQLDNRQVGAVPTMPPNAVYYYQHGYYTGSYSLSKAEDVTDATRVEEGAANLSKGNDDVEAVREGGLVREKKAISSSEDSNSSSESQNVEASSHTSGFIKQVSSKKKARPPPIFIPPSSAPLRPSITSPLKKPMSASIVTHPRGTGYFYPSPIFSEIPTPTSATSSSSYKASSLPSSSVRGQFVPIAPKPPQAYYPHISFSNYPFFNGTLKDHPHSATIPTTTFSAAMSAHMQSSKYSPILPRPSTITTKSASNSPLNSPLMKSPIVLPDPQITKSPGSPNSVAASDKESVGSDHATNPLDMLAEAASTIVRKKGESRKRASIENPLESGTNNDNEEGMEGGKKKRAKTTRSRKGKDPEQ